MGISVNFSMVEFQVLMAAVYIAKVSGHDSDGEFARLFKKLQECRHQALAEAIRTRPVRIYEKYPLDSIQ